MQDNIVENPPSSLPKIQLIFLLIVLLGYPALSIVMGTIGENDPAEITSKVAQVYLPTLFIQMILLVSLWYVLYRSRTRFSEIGFAREAINWSNVGSAIIFFIGAWGLMVLIKSSIIRSGYIPETDFLRLMPATAIEGGLWALLSAGAAFSEELIFRGFVITRLKRITGKFWIGAVLGSLAFSMGHLYQGMAGVLLTFIYGMLFAGLFAARRSVFPCVVAHFLQDIIVLGVLFVPPGNH
ncbi:MAG: type II CAAX endopeptidase family protein [candidate division Zixibacteria bacterium]